MDSVYLSKKILVYIPTYNCSKVIFDLLDDISQNIWDSCDILLVDNASPDGTGKLVADRVSQTQSYNGLKIIRTENNVGYAGSQKLAYRIATQYPSIENVVMLHGDGQYPPELLPSLLDKVGNGYGIVYGYRDKKLFKQEETPLITFICIKGLSILESLVTGYPRKEWHSGLVMYSREFLENVNFDAVTDTYHIDGHLQYASGYLGYKVKAVPIWKRYNNFEQFGGFNRVKYVFNVLRLTLTFRLSRSGLNKESNSTISPIKFKVLIP